MTDRQDQHELHSIETLFHDIATPLVIAKMKAELLARCLPQLLQKLMSEPEFHDLLPDDEKVLESLASAPEIMLSNLQLVQKKINLLSASMLHQVNNFSPSDSNNQDGLGPDHKGAIIKSILLVDDEDIHRDIGRSLLTPHYHVDFASNGLEAIRLCEQKEYDLVLMDLHMPKMNGEQATIALRQRVSNDTIIVGLTSLPIGVNRSGLMALGFNDFLEKPLTLKGLQKLLRSHSFNA